MPIKNMSSGLLLLSAAAASNCRDESSAETCSSRVSDRCDDEHVALGGLTSSSFASSSLSLPSSSLISPASHPSSLSKLPLKKRLKSAFRSPPSERTFVPQYRGEEASFSSSSGSSGTTFPRDDDHDGHHGHSFSNRLARPSKQSSWEAQLAACKELCKLDLVDMRFAATATAAAEGSSRDNDEKMNVHPRAFKAIGNQGRSDGRKEGENSSGSSDRNSKEGSSSSSSSSASSHKQQPSRKRNFSAYRFDCKDENGQDMGMGYFSMGAASSSSPSLSSPPHAHQHQHREQQRHPLPQPQRQRQRQRNRDDDNDKPVAVVSRENFAKFRVRTDSDASATARRRPHSHFHPRLSPWTSHRGRIGSGGHLPGIDDDGEDDGDDKIFQEYQKSAFLMSRLTVNSKSALPDLLLRGGATSTSSSSSPSLLARNATHHGKGNESWSGTPPADNGCCSKNVAMASAASSKTDSSKTDSSKALSSSSSSSGNGGVIMHPIPTTLHALSNLNRRSSNNNNNSRMTSSSSSSFFVLHRNTKKTVRPHDGSHLQPLAGDNHLHCHDHPLPRNGTIANSTTTTAPIQNDREAEMPKLRNFVKHASSREEATQEFVQAYIRTLQVRNHANMM